MFDIHNIMTQLAKKRPCFHSEADFQHALAWEIHLLHQYDIRLEVPDIIDNHPAHIDVVLLASKKAEIYLELKYKTSEPVCCEGETYVLKNHRAHDVGRHAFMKDVYRLEKLCGDSTVNKGVAVFLTNDRLYWNHDRQSPSLRANDEAFRVHEGASLNGTLRFKEERGWMNEDQKSPIVLSGQYACSWQPYSNPGSEFKYLAIPVWRPQ